MALTVSFPQSNKGYSRRNTSVPVSTVTSFEEFNKWLWECYEKDAQRLLDEIVRERLDLELQEREVNRINRMVKPSAAWCKILCKRNSTKSRIGAEERAHAAG